jgi:hypothetical protein
MIISKDAQVTGEFTSGISVLVFRFLLPIKYSSFRERGQSKGQRAEGEELQMSDE